jgi:REP element-mobilizing transposase RayT
VDQRWFLGATGARRAETSNEWNARRAGKHISLLVHFIGVQGVREAWISEEWREPLHAYMGAIITNKNGKLLAAGGMHDHIQLYASLPSTITLANFVIL